MRGDSLRDLYAKTLALVGLGMLAGTGALVDYWPAGVQVPAVASGVSLPVPAIALAGGTVVVEPFVDRSVRRPFVRPAALRLTNAAPTSFVAESEYDMSAPLVVDDTSVRTVQAPPLAVASHAIELRGPRVVLADPLPMPVTREASLLQAMEDPSADGFFSGAFKRTGSSLLRTGKKTGVSIVDVVRGLGGAVRKAIPTL